MIAANNPKLKSWVEVATGSDFPIQNLPFGIFKTADLTPRLCSAIGDQVIDLLKLNQLGFFTDLDVSDATFDQPYLNEFMAKGKATNRAVRNRLSELLDADNHKWNAREMASHFLHPMNSVELLLPVKVNDYTDFYSSIEHATNVGTMFRDPENALLPNWRHLPVGYHGRASSIVVSGTPIHRPKGQQQKLDENHREF